MINEAFIICPDVHGCSSHDERALQVFFAATRRLSELFPVTRFIQLGDLLDAAEFSSHPPTNIYEPVPSWQEELSWGVDVFWGTVKSILPEATLHFIEGNHEFRVHKYLLNRMGRGRLAEQAYEVNNACKAFEEIGVECTYYGAKDLKDSYLELNGIMFTHGWSHSTNVAKTHLDKSMSAKDVIFGHVHRITSYVRRDPATSRQVGAWSFGTLSEVQQYYQRATPNDHNNGFGLILFDEFGNKNVVTIPIHNENGKYSCILPTGDTIYA